MDFTVQNHILKRIDTNELLNYNFNEYKCRFTFEEGSEWIDINKFIIFYDGWGNSSISHIGNEETTYEVLIPSEVLKGSYFKVCVYGGDLLTTNSVVIPLNISGYFDSKDEYETFEKEYHDIFVEIFDGLDNSVDNMFYEDKQLHLYHKDELLESISLPFITREECMSIANSVLDDYFFDLPVVDDNHNGLMSSSDKIKLDNIQDRATRTVVDYNLDFESDNPISNRIVSNALNAKEDSYDFVERMDDLIQNLINNGL